MALQKTIFKKYILVITSVLLTSFLILGTVLMMFISEYWQREKRDTLTRSARSIVSLTESNMILEGNRVFFTNSNVMQAFILTFSRGSNADIFITDLNGEKIMNSEMESATGYESVPKWLVEQSQKGSYYTIDNMDESYRGDCFIVGEPIIAGRGTEFQRAVAVVFTVSDSEHLKRFQYDVFRMFLLAAVFSLVLSFFAISLLTYKVVKPLREMCVAAKCFGEGDFTKRVPVMSSDEIGQLALAFNNMAQSLTLSEGANRSFVANVSHELKTPMTTIVGFIDGILDGTIPKEKHEHYLRIVSDEIKRLSRLVRTMLDLSRIDNEEIKLNKKKFNITEMIIKVLLTFERLIEKKNISIRGATDLKQIFVLGDADMLYQVLYNLIDNAVKFTNEDGYIDIVAEETSDKVKIRIKNSGEGIALDEMSMIFDKFYKADKSRSHDRKGMGLGLYIVKRIVRAHQGDITVSSVKSEYCEFELWLPRVKEKSHKSKE